MRIGTSGARFGTTTEQRVVFSGELTRLCNLAPITVHHGNCKQGWDNDVHYVCRLFGYPVVRHPCNLYDTQMDLSDAEVYGDEVRAVKKPLVRNHDIAYECDIIYIVPATVEEVLRSGTWATARYAVQMGKPIRIIEPDGNTRIRI